MMATPEQRMIDVDGATLEVFLAGEGEPVVCMSHPFRAMSTEDGPTHGAPGRRIAVNPRGVGQSSAIRSPGDLTFQQHVSDLEAIRQQLGIARWVFVGPWAGGGVGLLYALQHPDALGGLVVAMMVPSGPGLLQDERSVFSPRHPDYRQALASRSREGQRPALLGALRPELRDAAWVPLGEEAWALVRGGEALIVYPGVYEERVLAAFEELVTVIDVAAPLHSIRTPTLIVAGAHDPYYPLPHFALYREAMPRAASVVLEGSGHGWEVGTPDDAQYQAALHALLERVSTSA
jgi:proline iminopeptidase